MHFMKEYFNSFDDIQFFHTFSSISRDMKIVTLNEIHRYIQNLCSTRWYIFRAINSRFQIYVFRHFTNIFRQLREKYAFKLKIKYIMLISSLRRNLMMCINMTFSKKTTPLHSSPLHSTHSTELFKIFFSLLTLSTAFLQKASGPKKFVNLFICKWLSWIPYSVSYYIFQLYKKW